MTAISGLISGLSVALIGFYATNVYNRRQRVSEERKKDQELVVAQIQTAEKFIPHLSSGNENIKAGALTAIAALGNEELAVKLATAFGGSGATAALTKYRIHCWPAGCSVSRTRSQRHLSTPSSTRGRPVGNGLVVAEGAWIVTPSYVVAQAMGISVSDREGLSDNTGSRLSI